MYDLEISREESAAFKQGDFVILRIPEEDREEVGKVVLKHDFHTVEHEGPVLLRKATDADVSRIARLQEDAQKTFTVFMEKIEKYHLDMQPVTVFFSFDGKYADLLFTAKERIDFRELVKDLASFLKKKIFLEQVGPRDRSAIANGCGTCGRTLCCSSFLKDPPPVTMTSVRNQNLFYKDREKLTGLCGKLKCCLNYELDVYEQLAKAFPPMQSEVKIKSTGKVGTIVGRSILDQQVKVLSNDGLRPVLVPLSDIQVLKAAIHKEHSAVAEVLE